MKRWLAVVVVAAAAVFMEVAADFMEAGFVEVLFTPDAVEVALTYPVRSQGTR